MTVQLTTCYDLKNAHPPPSYRPNKRKGTHYGCLFILTLYARSELVSNVEVEISAGAIGTGDLVHLLLPAI